MMVNLSRLGEYSCNPQTIGPTAREDTLSNTKKTLDSIREELTRLRMERAAARKVVEAVQSMVDIGAYIPDHEPVARVVGSFQMRGWQLDAQIPRMEREFGRLEKEVVRLETERNTRPEMNSYSPQEMERARKIVNTAMEEEE